MARSKVTLQDSVHQNTGGDTDNSIPSTRKRKKYDADDWERVARRTRRKLYTTEDKVEKLEGRISALQEAAEQGERRHIEELHVASRASGEMWWELQKTREGLTAEQMENTRIQRLLGEQDDRLAARLKELFDTKKSNRALSMQVLRRGGSARSKRTYYLRDSVVTADFQNRVRSKGAFTPAARAIALKLVLSGCAEHAVGGVIQELGRLVGIRRLNAIPRMSARTVSRIIAEGGIAAKIQLGYEIMRNTSLTASGDSTSHRRQEYDSRFVALKPVTATGTLSDTHVLRSLGVDASLNHSSEEQVRGLLKKLQQICEIFNRSPFAKRKGLEMSLTAFATRLRGTNGDHANDVKKDNKLLLMWKLELTKISLGYDKLRQMSPENAFCVIIPHARAVLLEVGGQAAWDALSDVVRAEKESAFMRSAAEEVGEQEYERLGASEKKRLSLFLFSGCCMHKELNSVKGGDTRMRTYYPNHPEVAPPVLLANKDNAAVLAGVKDGEQLTPAELRALSISGCGAVKATTLAGMICNNKDSKKGQHDRYIWYFDKELGPAVTARRFPDVSNTRFQSHCAASCEILVHLDLYRDFMRNGVYYKKEKPGFTNIEKNFFRALHCSTTLTEMAVLALYGLCVSCPYVRQIRGPGMSNLNALTLGPLHIRLRNFIEKLINDPSIILGDDAGYTTATFDGEEWERPGVFDAIVSLRPAMPHLQELLVEFLKGALETWERFTAEFDPSGDISQLTTEEQDEFWMPATNDANESALGGVRVNASARPNQTLHQFEAKDMFRRNDTQQFVDQEFIAEDHKFVRGEARLLQASRPQRQLQHAQVVHDEEEARRHQASEEQSNAKALERQIKLDNTVLITDAEKFVGVRKDALIDQLNYWRHRLLAKVEPNTKIPKNVDKVAELRKLLALFPGGVVPESERTIPKGKGHTLIVGPEAVLQDMPSISIASTEVVDHSVREEEGEEIDLLYESEVDDI
ncbi:uncharacterized protein SCHCODRAFT_02753181 [Schizophyllum commune H4-8]|uniref:Uncharacterized protein n=1 Tax=Schizophyllum commune (strain H4-8 / FGSC 9210) TaxID=578458 RepID=D8QI87_SCHCM|nr:uncharacterized protein SCHCODRAFT_02753181 [Schizophyllum commune H4-8]KAI5885906.1 hypothetical protein SCHCODRAFT_02753181 [Schizophyllum commune H4-8]